MVEFCRVVVGQRILVLRLLQPTAHRDVLSGLHEELHALQLGDLRLQALDNLVHAVALIERLELDEHPGGALARVGAGRTGKADNAGNRGILQDDRRNLVLQLAHRGEGRVQPRLQRTEDEAGVLLQE